MEKLPPEAFAAEAARVANTTPERLHALCLWLDRHESSDCSFCWATLRRLVRFARDPCVTAPPTEERRLLWAAHPDALAASEYSIFEFFALAAQLACEDHPPRFQFGLVTSRRI